MCQTPDWSVGDRYLRENAPELSSLIDRFSPCTLKPRPQEDYFAILLTGIVAQQLPPDVSQEIMQKLEVLLGKPITPAAVAQASTEALVAQGLMAQKAEYVHNFAQAVMDEQITLNKFQEMTDEEITRQLLQIRGLGKWTIEMFLLLALCRTDVIPFADFIFQKQLQKLLGLKQAPKRGQIKELTARWSPWRSLAVWYLWAKNNNEAE